jgi:mycothiol system anti-sigma-R factor
MADGDLDEHEADDVAAEPALTGQLGVHYRRSTTHVGHDHGNCEEALHELYTYLDGELTEVKRAKIQHHLDDCSPCLEVFDFEAELRIVIKQRCQDEVPESLRVRVAQRLAIIETDPGRAEPQPFLPGEPVADADPHG